MLSGITVAAITAASAAPAAAISSDPRDLADLEAAAASAAQAADAAFIDADWETVLVKANAFDAVHAEIEARRAAAAAVAASALTARDAAEVTATEAQELHREKQIARNKAKSAADEQEAVVDSARKARNKAVTALRAANDEVERLEGLEPGVEQDIADAEELVGSSQSALTAAEEAYATPVIELIGAQSWWTDVISDPITVAQLFDRIAAAKADVEAFRVTAQDAQDAINGAQDELDRATGFVARLVAAARLASAVAEHGPTLVQFALLEARVTALQRAADQTGATALHDALTAAQSAHDEAVAALADANDELTALHRAIETARDEAADAQQEKDAKQQALFAAQALRDELRAVQEEAHAALMAAKGPRDAAAAALEAAQTELDGADAALATLDEALARLAAARQAVADRRADLADLEVIRSEVVWASLDMPEVARPGDVVKLTFEIPAPSVFHLLDATVAVVSPEGLTPVCDIPADGVVPAGSVVSCTVLHEVTFADLLAGEVVVDVKLSGYLPLGPGNPRATSATRTFLEVDHTVAFDVEALVAELPADTESNTPVPTDAALADTGAHTALIAPAFLLTLVGAALVIGVRRERA